jgi:hypothetical protein
LFPIAKAFFEAFYATSFVDDFVVAGKEWMACTADVSTDGWYCGASAEFVTAAATDFTVDVVRVDIILHGETKLVAVKI